MSHGGGWYPLGGGAAGGGSVSFVLLLLLFALSSPTVVASKETSLENFETVHSSNAAILNRLGLAPLRIPDGHHKKRLAGPEPPAFNSQTRVHQAYSRRHGHRDSHIYIVKLPASPPYYTITKPHKSVKDEKVVKSGGALPVGFHGNGKPAKVYHWNLPLMKKITEKKRQQAQMRLEQARKKFDETKTRTAADKRENNVDSSDRVADENYGAVKRTRNNDKRLSYPDERKSNSLNGTGKDKSFRLDDSNLHRIEHLNNEIHAARNAMTKVKKHRKKAAMSYYAPIVGKSSSTSIHKNFSGNGKPKGFYVMEKSRKPVYYHPLLP